MVRQKKKENIIEKSLDKLKESTTVGFQSLQLWNKENIESMQFLFVGQMALFGKSYDYGLCLYTLSV